MFGSTTQIALHLRHTEAEILNLSVLFLDLVARIFHGCIQSDSVEFMSWLLNTLHRDLGGTKKAKSSMIYKWFQGESEVFKEVQKRSIMDKRDEAINGEDERAESYEVKRETRMPFLMLDLDFPPPPLFNYAMEKNIIPQVPLFNM